MTENNIVVEEAKQIGGKGPTLNRALEENEFELPIGITLNGEFHKTITLTEMTGATEEAIADPKIRSNGGKVITKAIEGVTEKLGSISKVNSSMVRALYAPDRDFIMLMNYLVSVDDVIEYTDDCKKCGEKNDIEIPVADIEVKYMDESEPKIFDVVLPSGIKKTEDGEVKRYKNIKISLPKGTDQEQVFTLLQQNASQAVTRLLSLICEDIEGLADWNPDTFKDMTKKDRKHIQKVLGDIDVGANLQPTVTCANCGDDFESSIPVPVLLGE